MKLALASSLLSVLCFPEDAAAFTASRPKIAAVRSSSDVPQTSVVALQAVANANNDNERNSQHLNRRDALFRFASATAAALVSGSQIAVAADEEAIADPATAVAEPPSSTSSATSSSNTLSVVKEDDFKSAPPSPPPKDVEIKVAMEKSPSNPVAKQPMDDSKLVAKLEEEEVKAPVAAKKEVELKVAALEKDEKQEPAIKTETNLFAKISDDETESASTLLLPGGKSVINKAAAFPSGRTSTTASVVAPAKTTSTVIAALDAPGKQAATIDSNTIIGVAGIGAVLVGLAALANNDDEMTAMPTGTAPPGAALPYGLDAGRVYGEAPPKPPAPAIPPAPLPVLDPELIEAQKKWKASQPPPYGIANKNKNPFIKEMYENCEGGKVTEKCTETLTEYMEDIASTGAVASDEEVNTIVSYLDSVSSQGESTGAAIAGYLDALSVGTAPGPKDAKAVAGYLDTLGGGGESVPKSFSPRRYNPGKPAPVAAKPAPVAPAPVAAAPVAAAPSPDFSNFDSRLKQIESQGSSTSSMIQQYDSRLTTIETRVTSLESKVDAIPDQVFTRMDAWQSKADLRLSEEVKKIIAILTPEAQEPPSTPPAAAPVVPPPAPVPAPVPAPPAPVVSSTPAAASMSNPMLAGKAASAPKKGYGLGSGNWKK